MGSQVDLDFLNMTLADTPRTLAFHKFPKLPKELRLQIWEAAVPRERLIHVSLKVHQARRYALAAAEPRYLERNSLKKPISGERYRAVVQGSKLDSKFLSVNHESRQVALAFYRVRIPVYLTGPTSTQRTTMLFNPEHDILHIEAEAPVQETLVDFLWDLKAYDPKDVGLLKLAVDLHSFCANDLPYLQRSDLLLIRQRAALVDTLSQLTAVWFVVQQAHKKPRHWPRDAASTPQPTSAGMVGPPSSGGESATFERAGPNRWRGASRALERVWVGDVDPREVVFRWRRLLRTWGVAHDAAVDYRMLLARAPDLQRRRRRSLHGLEVPWNDGLVAEGLPASMDPAPVFGSWLFPVEAMGEIGEGETLADMDFSPGRVVDMRAYRPELILPKVF